MCKQRENIWRQRSGNAQTMTKKEAVIIICSEMRTEGTSGPSAGMFPADGSIFLSPCNLVQALEFSLMAYL